MCKIHIKAVLFIVFWGILSPISIAIANANVEPPIIVNGEHNLIIKEMTKAENKGKKSAGWTFTPSSAWKLKYSNIGNSNRNSNNIIEISVDTASKSFRERYSSSSLDISDVIKKAKTRTFRFGCWVKVDTNEYRRNEIFTVGLYGDYGFCKKLREFCQHNLWTYLEGRVAIPDYVKNVKLELFLWVRKGKASVNGLYLIPENSPKPIWKCNFRIANSPSKWLLTDRKYRIGGSVTGKVDNQPLWVDFDFARLMLLAGVRNPIDPSSVKVLAIGKDRIVDVPVVFDNPLSNLNDHYKRNGTLKWRTIAGLRKYEIYFNAADRRGARPIVLKHLLGIGELINYPQGTKSILWAGWPGFGVEVKDVDADGDNDIYVKSNDADIWLARNIGTNSAPVFVPRMKPTENDVLPMIQSQALSVDWDNDGDNDLISYTVHRRGGYTQGVWASLQIRFNENGRLGTPVDMIDMHGRKIIFDNACWFAFTSGDFDGDGLQDLAIGSTDSSLAILLNRYTKTSAARVKKQFIKWNIYRDNIYDSGDMSLKPFAVDWNKDGRDDLVLTGWSGYVRLLINRNVPNKAEWNRQIFLNEINGLLSVADSPTPTAVDWNGDGLIDLICGDVCGHLTYFKNIGTKKAAKFAAGVRLRNELGEPIRVTAAKAGATIQGPSERWWGYLSCQAEDVDRDGDLDLIINDSLGRLRWIENIGLRKHPVLSHIIHTFIDSATGLPVITPWRNRPGVADINNDGITEIIVLNKQGALVSYSISPEHPDFLLRGPKITNRYGKPVAVNASAFTNPGSGRSQIEAADWDGDGDIDILVGRPRDRTGGGNILLFTNIGSRKKMILKSGFLLARGIRFVEWTGNDGHDQWHSGCPCVADLDNDGKSDLIHGVESGRFAFYSHDFFIGDSFPVFKPNVFEMKRDEERVYEVFSFTRGKKAEWYSSLVPLDHPLQWLEKDIICPKTARSVKIIAPVNNATVSGKIVFEADATGNNLMRVEFYVDGKLLAIERLAPYIALGDNSKWDTHNVRNGMHRLSVKAIYLDGTVLKAKSVIFVRN